MKQAIPLAALLVLLAGCSAPHVGARAGVGFTELDGDVGIQSGDVASTNSTEDLGLDDDEPFPFAGADFRWGSPHLTVGYGRAGFSGTGTASAEISQGGTTIPVGALVDSELDVGVGSALVTFDLVPTEAFEAGIGLGLASLDLDGEVREIATGESVAGSQVFVMPVLAARAGARFGPFQVEALASGTRLDFEGDTLDYYDLDLNARYDLFRGAWLGAGWREVGADVEFDDDGADVEVDLRLRGPYLALTLAF